MERPPQIATICIERNSTARGHRGVPLAFAGGGFWWISWGPATEKDDFGGVLLGVILIGAALWGASVFFTLKINKLTKKPAQRTSPDFLTALKALVRDWRTILLWVLSIGIGVPVLRLTVWFGTPLLLHIANFLFGTSASTLKCLPAELRSVTVMMFSPILMMAGTVAGVYVAIFILGKE